jgi:hypothetical protein
VSCSTPCSECLDCRSLGVGATVNTATDSISPTTTTPADVRQTSWPVVGLTVGLIGMSVVAFVFALKHAGR